MDDTNSGSVSRSCANEKDAAAVKATANPI
jgi:hypothetical protein